MFSGVTLLQSDGTKGMFVTATSRKFFCNLACEQASGEDVKKEFGKQGKYSRAGEYVDILLMLHSLKTESGRSCSDWLNC